jgi:FkbM family methyltransferase
MVTLQYQEVLGLSAFVNGGFEDAECRLLAALTSPESTAIDVGANVGIHAVPMAASSPSAKVLAIEPVSSNVRRLLINVQANLIENIEVIEVAIGSHEGLITLHVADDPAYASTAAVVKGQREIGELAVEQTTLDVIWERSGRPTVSVIKIDVEGSELAVLNGAPALLASQHPAILIEAHGGQFGAVAAALAKNGYRPHRAEGLQPWNHLFQATEKRRPGGDPAQHSPSDRTSCCPEEAVVVTKDDEGSPHRRRGILEAWAGLRRPRPTPSGASGVLRTHSLG